MPPTDPVERAPGAARPRRPLPVHTTAGPPLTWTVGDVRVTRVEEHIVELPTRALVPGITPEMIATAGEWLNGHFTDDGLSMLLSIHTFVVVSGDLTVVVDTCIGGDAERSLPGDSTFVDRLEASIPGGFDAVDVVLCTHLHFDHVGLNTRLVDGTWTPTFPNADYLVSQPELEHTQAEEAGHSTGVWATSIAPLADAGLLRPVSMNHRIDGQLRLLPSPGHTPGHVCLEIVSGAESGVITGDLVHTPLQFARPEISSTPADDDSDMAIASRGALIEQLVDTETLILATHFAPPTAGRLRTSDNGIELAW